MFNSKKLMLAVGLLVIAGMLVSACQQAAVPTPEVQVVEKTVMVTQVVKETAVSTVIQVITDTPEPTQPAGPRTMVICMGQEPDTLYNLKGAMLAKSSVLEAIYDGPIDANSYAYQAVILEKMPSLADGDAVLNTVTVKDGDKVVDADQNVVNLDAAADPPQHIVPAGQTEAITYTGGEVQMEQLAVTFKLLPGLMWSDGTPLTSADSVYGFNLLADPDTTSPSSPSNAPRLTKRPTTLPRCGPACLVTRIPPIMLTSTRRIRSMSGDSTLRPN
jgi:peptide/nickel transport system substrate-binding protein